MDWFLYDNSPRHERVKGMLSRLIQFFATKSPLKLMKNAFYITLNAHSVLKIFKPLSGRFGHA